jgi:ADP-ribose pyrophosphatase YjhB (NUDIX family)
MSEEEIIVVDKDNKVLGTKPRSQISTSDYFRVSGLWITDLSGNILLARRAEDLKHNPGMWDFAVAGTLAAGETYRSNIIKEAEEELGLTGLTLEEGPESYFVNKQNYQIFLQVFKTILPPGQYGKIRFPKSIIAEIKWFTGEELKRIYKDNPSIFVKEMAIWINLLV